ncbi:S-locus-specific glycoprotein S6-like [Durio zibethinus]|uniref:S-locus-specific glycoprotein S6-like n=1 Tax=Durio zibethinus TaxID=66656 RepID=A0A6P5WPP4_DURZI|nr:S-locus-specific glycoprotein S6-like [Durio zibethinus]
MHYASKVHFQASKKIVRYIKGTVNYGIKYFYYQDFKLYGYFNSDWASSVDDMKNTTAIEARRSVARMFYQLHYSLATDTITPVQSNSDGETLKIPRAVVWVANRNSPIADAGGVLTNNSDGKLILFDGTNNTVWSSNVSRKAEGPVALLLDSGNFVVKDNKTMKPAVEIYLWQSFDYLSEILLPGIKLGRNLKTGSEWFLTAWKSADDLSPGNFSCRLSIQGLASLVTYRDLNSGRSHVFNRVTFVAFSDITEIIAITVIITDQILYLHFESQVDSIFIPEAFVLNIFEVENIFEDDTFVVKGILSMYIILNY